MTETPPSSDIEPRDADFSALETPEASISEAEPANELQQQVEKLTKEVAENKDKYLRALADLDNTQKRHQRERSELIRYQGERLLVDLLTVVDNLERALADTETRTAAGGQTDTGLYEGLKVTLSGFLDILGRWEVKPSPAIGKIFDPALHRALARVPQADIQPNTVVQELRKAYTYRDRLLRPADVIVADAPVVHPAAVKPADEIQAAIEEAADKAGD